MQTLHDESSAVAETLVGRVIAEEHDQRSPSQGQYVRWHSSKAERIEEFSAVNVAPDAFGGNRIDTSRCDHGGRVQLLLHDLVQLVCGFVGGGDDGTIGIITVPLRRQYVSETVENPSHEVGRCGICWHGHTCRESDCGRLQGMTVTGFAGTLESAIADVKAECCVIGV